MYHALLTKATGSTGIYWSSTDLNILKENVTPFFNNLKLLKQAGLIKGVPCIRFYQDGNEQHFSQWGSI